MRTAAAYRSIPSIFVALLLADSIAAQSIPDREVSQIRVDGLKTVSEATIHLCLASLPEILEASHAGVDRATYIYRVREAVARGMLASGFLDSQVDVSDESSRLKLVIREGPRVRRGSIVLDGASDATQAWIRSHLLVASTAEEDASPVWEPGEPANGTLFGSMQRSQRIQQCLTEIGLSGSDAVVEFVRNDAANTLDLRLKLASSDATFLVPTAIDDPDADAAQRGSSDHRLLAGIGGELQEIRRRWFAEPTPGIRFREVGEEMTLDMAFGQTTGVATIESGEHRRRLVLDQGDVLVRMDDPRAAIRIPLPNATVVFCQQSEQESEQGKTMRIAINGAFSIRKPERPPQLGFVFSEQGWADWFPPELTKRSEDDRVVNYSYADHELRIDHQGQLVALSGTDPNGRQFHFDRIAESAIRALAVEIAPEVEPAELVVRDSHSGHRIALREFFRSAARNRAKDEEFHIPPAGGRREHSGMVILSMVNDGKLFAADSLIGRLSELYALELSGNRRGLGQRISEIEPEALHGPITATIVSDLWERLGNIERALNGYSHAQWLAEDSAAVQYDIAIITDSTNLIGRICEDTDLNRFVQQSIQLADPLAQWASALSLRNFMELIAQLPEARTKPERTNNARSLLTLAYDMYGRTILSEHLGNRIMLLESRQKKMSKKKQAKKKR